MSAEARRPLSVETLFLDAGGVLCHPSWTRVSDALAGYGIEAPAARLAAAEPHAKRDIDRASLVRATTDDSRGWVYFDRVLAHAGIEKCEATDAALALMRDYHRTQNLWEVVPDEVRPALGALRGMGFKLVVVSNANGRLRHLFERVGLAPFFDAILDSHEWGVEKPDPRLFHHALDASSSRAETTAHVGDLFHIDVEGARAAGLCEGVLLDQADLYADADCRRVRTLVELVSVVRLAR